MAELVLKKWKDNNVSTLKFQHNKNKFYQGCKLIRNKMNKVPLTLDNFFLLLYVDDGALTFSSKNEAILGSNIIFEQMARMGLKMHVETGSKASKTEAIYFPSRFKITSWLLYHESLQISSYRETFSLVEAGKKQIRMDVSKCHQRTICRLSLNF